MVCIVIIDGSTLKCTYYTVLHSVAISQDNNLSSKEGERERDEDDELPSTDCSPGMHHPCSIVLEIFSSAARYQSMG